jgi:hypothetical protein
LGIGYLGTDGRHEFSGQMDEARAVLLFNFAVALNGGMPAREAFENAMGNMTDAARKTLGEPKKPDPSEGCTPASHYYFAVDHPDEDDPEWTQFLLVHRRYWHMEHCLWDGGVHGNPPIPEGFSEVSGATFEYAGTGLRGRRKLLDAGFVELASEVPGPFSRMHVVRLANRGDRYFVSVTFDSAELRDRFWGWAEGNTEFDSISGYCDRLREWGEDQGLAVGTFNHYGSGCYAYVMERAVYDSLPEYPKEEE